MFERMSENESEYDCDCLILKDASTDAAVILKAVDCFISDGKKVKIFDGEASGVTYRQVLDLREGHGE